MQQLAILCVFILLCYINYFFMLGDFRHLSEKLKEFFQNLNTDKVMDI